MAAEDKCSKCGGPLDTTGYPKWCKACKSADAKERRETLESKGYQAGAEAMRRALMASLGSSMPPDGMLRCAETLHWLETFQLPQA